jgi:PAS domain S-box-containing protein
MPAMWREGPAHKARSRSPDWTSDAAQVIARLGSWEFDLASGAMTCSAELRRLLGWSNEMMPSLAAVTVSTHPEDRAAVTAWLAAVSTGRSLAPCRFRVASGEAIHIEARVAVTLTEGGRPRRIAGTMQDVTAWVSAEQGIRQDAELYRGMFDHAVWGLYRTTLQGHYLAANPALARIYGYESPAAMMTALTDIGQQLYVEPTRRNAFVQQMRENGAVSGFESEVRRRDGSTIWISESCREVRDSTDQLICYEGSVEDITARKRAELELFAAKEQAEAASKSKSTFLANMSHELRTPLNAVLGFAEILAEELFGPLGDRRYANYARDIQTSGKHLLDVINDILDLSKVEAGHLGLDEREIEVGELLASCERVVAEAARKGEIRLEVVPPVVCACLRADPMRLKQVLLNLLSNAIKFTPAGNQVTLSARHGDDGGFLLEVADTGIGMRAEDIPKALQPFQQIDSSLARRYEGTGLGLTLSKVLVELHGGELALDSALGRGTTVTVRLPPDRVC